MQMKLIAFCALASAVAIGCGVPAVQPSPPNVETTERPQIQVVAEHQSECEHLVDVLASEATTVAERIEAEQQLSKLSPALVFAAIFPKVSKGVPPGYEIYGTRGAEDEKYESRDWREFKSYHRVWGLAANTDPKGAREFLATQLRVATSPEAQCFLLGKLRFNWSDEAEEPTARILRNVETGNLPRRLALHCLARHRRDKYDAEMKEVVRQLPANDWKESIAKAEVIQGLIAEPLRQRRENHRKETQPVDQEIVRLGFELLEAMRLQGKQLGYFLALELGDYVGESFKPEQNNPRYRSPHGLHDEFFEDTVANAIAWWHEHQNEYRP